MPDDRRSVGVRVRPDAHDFIRQLRADLSKKKYTFYVDVGANTAQATKDVRQWALTDLKRIRATVPVHANTGPASRDVADWRRRQAAVKTVIKVTADTSEARREIEALRAMARDVTVKVRSETSRAAAGGGRSRRSSVDKDFEQGLKKGLDAAMSRLDEIPVKVTADTRPAKAQTEEFRRREAAKEIKTQLDIDTKVARLKLLEMRLQEKAKKISIDVDVKTSKLDQFVRRLKDIEKSTGNLTIIRSLDFGPFNLGKPSGLVGTLTTITALAGAIPGAVTGLAAMSDALVRLAGAAALVPGAIGAITASIGTLALGSQGVGDAIGAMFDMWNEGASQQDKAATRVTHAQNNYTDAVADEAKAQRNVASARREALSDLRSLNNELRGGVLNEAQALLDLQKARDRYAQGGFENETERLQASLDIQKAEQNVLNTREDNLNLQQKANDAQAKGVEGSDKVTDALQAQAQATERTAEAMEALSAGGAGATTATQKFNDMLAQLSPNAREFVETIAGMKGEMFNFRNAIQDTLFQGAGPAFANMFHNLIPIIQPGMQEIAQGLNQNLLQVFDTLQSPDGKSIIERILGGTAETQKALTGLIDPLTRGVGTLVAAGTEHMPQVVNLFTQLADRFANFIEKADENGSLDKFLTDGVDAMADLAETGINLVKIINDFSTAFRGAFGEDILSMIARITGEWHDFLSSDAGQQKLLDFIGQAKELWGKWEPVLEKLPGLLGNVSDAAVRVLDYMLPVLEKIAGLLERFPGLVEAFAAVWLAGKTLTMITTVVNLAKTFGGMAVSLGKMAASAGELAMKLAGLSPGVLQAAAGGPGVAAGTPGAPIAAAGGGAAATAAAGAGTLLAFGALLVTANEAEKAAAENEGRTRSVPIGPRGANVQIKPTLPSGVPEPQTDEARKAVQAGVDKNDPSARWVAAGRDTLDWQKRYVWVVTHPNQAQAGSFSPPDSYMAGGYTDWGASSGRIIEAHGGEYIQPKPTVDRYGVDAMRAVHAGRAVIGYNSGGMIPAAYPGNPRVPFMPGIGGGLGSYNPNAPGYLPGGRGSGMGGMTIWEWLKRHPQGFQGGGLVWDPNTRQYVQEGASISHGMNPTAPGPGIIDTVVGGAASGGSSFVDSFLGSIGIPGLGGRPAADAGPGWGEGGPPIGLGGGPDGFDIRNFGIGPGPPGSGPSDWLSFTGATLGKFGSSLVTTFLGGILSGVGLSGLGSYISSAGGVAEHFLGTDKDKSSVQGPGAAQTNADVQALQNTVAGMPTNPDYPGVANLPNVFDPSTGSAVTTPGTSTTPGTNLFPAGNVGSYGLPAGSNVSYGSKGFPDWVYTMGQRFGLQASTYGGHQESDRPDIGATPNPNHLNRGIDWRGTPAEMRNFAASLIQSGAAEMVIYRDPETGVDYTYPPGVNYAGDLPGHTDHVHTRFGGAPPIALIPTRQPQKVPAKTPSHQHGDSRGHRNRLPIRSFAYGGYNTGVPVIPKPVPRPPNAIQMKPPPPPVVAPKPSVPAITPSSPPTVTAAPPAVGVPHAGTGAPPGPPTQDTGQISLGPFRPATGVGPSETGDHVHPALRKGITSGFATAGSIAGTAVNLAASMGTMGAGGGGGGGAGAFVEGLFQQAGKIATNVANVASSFLVGNITGGTTANPYGVTQRGNVPSGGTKVIDASNNQYGDVYTNDLDEYFKRVDRRNSQQAQAGLGRWASQ